MAQSLRRPGRLEAGDLSTFRSNDPKTPNRDLVRTLGLTEVDADVERNRRIQDQARGNSAAR